MRIPTRLRYATRATGLAAALLILGACGGGGGGTSTPAPTQVTLTVTLTGTGTGQVQSTPAGVLCGSVCSASYAPSAVVTLQAQPNSGSHFVGWNNACTGTGACTVTLDVARTVEANFAPDLAGAPGAPTLTSSVGGGGTATLSFTAPAGSVAVDHYIATCGASGQALRTATATGSPIVVSGLTGGVTYTCSIAAQNAAGVGPASNTQNVLVQTTSIVGQQIGIAGESAWDALAASEKARLKNTVKSFFLHQSVGGDLEDGAGLNGFAFSYIDSSATSVPTGLNGGLFFAGNGDPVSKINEFRGMALANKTGLGVAIMKFCYTDIVPATLADAETAYLNAVTALKAQGIRVLHISPALAYNTPDDNLARTQMRAWMLATFPNDVIFDLQDIESTDPATGLRCQRNGTWEICNAVRSTASCPSNSNGVDDIAGGQGHLCLNPHAQNISKAFLYAIYRASL